jgi:hypothetical protein
VKFIPYHRFEIVSPLKPAAALAVLAALTRARKSLSLATADCRR